MAASKPVIVAGIDIGSRGTKTVILKDGDILAYTIKDTGAESVKTSYMGINSTLAGTGLELHDLDYVVATGYGRVLVPFAQENVSEISCHAKGINHYYPQVRTILDMGGQDCKAISVDNEGRVTNFVMNDKCAGGTGRFLEMIASVLGLTVQEIGELSLKSTSAFPFNTICAVFAKTEAISYLRHGVSKSDILAGLHTAISVRCLNLLQRVGINKEFSITGGIAKNQGMVAKIKEKVGLEPLLAKDPQIIGARGAALFAHERFLGQENREDFKINYGYTDATGNYFIVVDNALCDGCGKCVSACPARIFEIDREDGRQRVRVTENARKRLSILCPGSKNCPAGSSVNCSAVCASRAINLTW
jgi:predicted CoA-substrate-specific enzyme activase